MKQLSLFEKADLILGLHDDMFVAQSKLNQLGMAWHSTSDAKDLVAIHDLRAEIERISDAIETLEIV